MKNSLFKDYLKLLKQPSKMLTKPILLNGDERQIKETNRIFANGMTALCCVFFIFAIIYETLDFKFNGSKNKTV